ncbi:uncharacterized protein N7482_003729 [Penicillium canariense]|uniref:GPI anchored protein n=1 Tax=Penicillium canariense TaxID=189055 RepID=A0A9W9I5A3_9EURO|nr:uncharacterized protein N7482_003729 [Penicillium canariense]KAJ5168135.1 hypothetical protein N7482_003729 [Penicillium canariense]
MVNFAKQAGVSLLLLFAAAVAEEAIQDEAQQLWNATLNIAQVGSLNTRDLFGLEPRAYECRTGYSECAYDTSRCCATGTSCCGNGYCADPGDTCCTSGTCPSGWNCCGDNGYCSPVGGECCNGGYYCRAGKHCRIYNGEKVCCPSSGCAGEYDSGSLGSTVTAVESVTETETSSITSTYHYTYASYDYYYTTYYWTYWFYFWTSYSPYTVKTVTSTRTTTTTIWSAYLVVLSAHHVPHGIPPYSATSLKSSTSAVPIQTASSSTTSGSSSSSNGGGGISGINSASGLFIDINVILMGTVLAAVFGGLAFAL